MKYPPSGETCLDACPCTRTDCYKCRADVKHMRAGGMCCATCFNYCEFCDITIYTDTHMGNWGLIEDSEGNLMYLCHCCNELLQKKRPKNWFSSRPDNLLFVSWSM